MYAGPFLSYFRWFQLHSVIQYVYQQTMGASQFIYASLFFKQIRNILHRISQIKYTTRTLSLTCEDNKKRKNCIARKNIFTFTLLYFIDTELNINRTKPLNFDTLKVLFLLFNLELSILLFYGCSTIKKFDFKLTLFNY